jgi:hypothetical protein
MAQSVAPSSLTANALPSAPEPSQSPSQPAVNEPQTAATGNISGTVLDTNNDVVQSATVTLEGPSGKRIVTSGSDGQFQFPNLAPGDYKLTVSAQGMRPFTSPEIRLNAGEFRIAPAITLTVSG